MATAKPRTKVGPKSTTPPSPFSGLEKKCDALFTKFIQAAANDVELNRQDNPFKKKNVLDDRKFVSTEAKQVLARIYYQLIDETKKSNLTKNDLNNINAEADFKKKSDNLHTILSEKWGDYERCVYRAIQYFIFSNKEIWDAESHPETVKANDEDQFFSQKIIEDLVDLKTCEGFRNTYVSSYIYFLKALALVFVKTSWFRKDPKLKATDIYGFILMKTPDDAIIDNILALMPIKKPSTGKKPGKKTKQTPAPAPPTDTKKPLDAYIDEEPKKAPKKASKRTVPTPAPTPDPKAEAEPEPEPEEAEEDEEEESGPEPDNESDE